MKLGLMDTSFGTLLVLGPSPINITFGSHGACARLPKMEKTVKGTMQVSESVLIDLGVIDQIYESMFEWSN